MSQNEKVFQMADMMPSAEKLNQNGQSSSKQAEQRNFTSLDNNQEFDPEKFTRNQPQNVETNATNNLFNTNDPTNFREENTGLEGPQTNN